MFLDVLDDDVILLIIDALKDIHQRTREKRLITNLSSTSRRLRRACLPVLFEQLHFGGVLHNEFFPPHTVWVYIRALVLAITTSYITQFCENARDAFPQWSQLRSIRLVRCDGGITVDIMQIILSPPALEELSFVNIMWKDRIPYEVEMAPIRVPIRKFVFTMGGRLRDDPSELYVYLESILVFRILEQIHTSLEFLLIPTESVELGLMSCISWPSLQELTLFGICPIANVPIASVICEMPRLRVLKLAFILRGDDPCMQVWPADFSTHLEFPHLETLILSFPDPYDNIFSKITSNLRHLSLRDTPRRYYGLFHAYVFNYSVPSCSELPRILRNARNASSLVHLEIVYRAEDPDRDADLFYTISRLFPLLSFLEVHRYRPYDDFLEVDVRNIVTNISTVKQLKTLRLNLYLPGTPDPVYSLPERLVNFKATLIEHCHLTASIMPWLDTLAFLHMTSLGNFWLTIPVEYNDAGPVTLGDPEWESTRDATFF